MKKIFLIATLLGVVMGTTRGQTIESIDSIVTIKNNKQAISFNLRNGLFDVTNQKREKVIENAFFQMGGIQSKDKQVSRSYTTEAITDSLGNGKMLTIRINVNHYSDFVWQAILYQGNQQHLQAVFLKGSKKPYTNSTRQSKKNAHPSTLPQLPLSRPWATNPSLDHLVCSSRASFFRRLLLSLLL